MAEVVVKNGKKKRHDGRHANEQMTMTTEDHVFCVGNQGNLSPVQRSTKKELRMSMRFSSVVTKKHFNSVVTKKEPQ